ncbi:MAG: hypothetical protein JW927_06460 [Deltaproteobacteria bacterium]|nr:hypothetical protein [Deltaproteobacteria bacterium]
MGELTQVGTGSSDRLHGLIDKIVDVGRDGSLKALDAGNYGLDRIDGIFNRATYSTGCHHTHPAPKIIVIAAGINGQGPQKREHGQNTGKHDK